MYIITMKEMNNIFNLLIIFARAPGITGAKGITMNDTSYMITYFCKKDCNLPTDTFFDKIDKINISRGLKGVYEMVSLELNTNEFIYVATEKMRDGRVFQGYGLKTSIIEGFKIDVMQNDPVEE